MKRGGRIFGGFKEKKWAVLILLTVLLTALSVLAASASEEEPVSPASNPALSVKKLKMISTKKTVLRLMDSPGQVTWKTSNKKVVRILSYPSAEEVKIKALKAGKAVITAKAGGKKYTCKVTVVSKPTLSKKKKTLKEGKSFELKVGGTVSKPTWTSDNPQVASLKKISSRTYAVTGHEPGTTRIRARVDGKVLTCRVRVKMEGKNAVAVSAGYTGWKRASGRTWYFINGRQLRGWQKIGGYWYYFTYDGMKTNCIAGNSSGGWYYVNSQGIRVTDPQICMAVGFVRACSSDSQSRMARLRRCFKTMCTYTYSWFPDSPGPAAFPSYASHTFRAKIANCWRYGAAMAYVARVLGYDSRVSLGGVTAHGPNYPLSAHGWCEVYTGGAWKMIDVSMQKHHPEVSLFLVPRARYPFRLQVNSSHPMTVNGTNVIWS